MDDALLTAIAILTRRSECEWGQIRTIEKGIQYWNGRKSELDKEIVDLKDKLARLEKERVSARNNITQAQSVLRKHHEAHDATRSAIKVLEQEFNVLEQELNN